MKVRAPSQNGSYFDVKKLIHGAKLHTICEEARCPNIAECWGRGTATFQILGETCTRACRYCYVHSGKPSEPVDALEPLRLAQTAKQMGLKHVVVTSVDRDDVDDKGAGHYAATIRAMKAKLPEASIEVLTPDFLGVEEQALQTVIGARPDVFNHNIETVRRLHRKMRGGKASYDGALWLLQRAKEIADYDVLTKSGIIVGLGETNDEVVETMRDLRAHGVDVVTIGQYLQPSAEARDDRPLGAPGRVPLVPRAGRGARLRLGLLRPARPLELPRGRAAPRCGDRPRRGRLLNRRARASQAALMLPPRSSSAAPERQLAGRHRLTTSPVVWQTAPAVLGLLVSAAALQVVEARIEDSRSALRGYALRRPLTGPRRQRGRGASAPRRPLTGPRRHASALTRPRRRRSSRRSRGSRATAARGLRRLAGYGALQSGPSNVNVAADPSDPTAR